MAHLIIGATGAIGKSLVHGLGRRGDKVIAACYLDPLPKSLQKLVAVQKLGVDVRNINSLRDIFADHPDIKTVWNMAAPLSMETAKDPATAEAVSVGGMANVLQVMKEMQVQKIMFTDSIGSCGRTAPRKNFKGHWLTENPAQNPGSDYGVQKRACRELMNEFTREHGGDSRWAVVPGVLHTQASWGDGTTEYALDALKAAAEGKSFVCPVDPDVQLPMVFVDDLVQGLISLSDAPEASLNEPENGYSLAGFSISANQLFHEIRRYYPDFSVTHTLNPHMNKFANLWPDSLSPEESERDLKFTAQWGFKKTVGEIIKAHSDRHPTGLNAACQAELRVIKQGGTYKSERVITTPQQAAISTKERGDKSVLNFCANNYLGLSNHPEIVKAGKAVMDTHGFGLSSVRFICGTQDIHKQLEKKLAEFHGMGDAILFPSGFDANTGLFEVLLGKEDALFSDALNHASIIDGVRLCKARRFRYNHLDMADLESKLNEAKDCRLKLIVTDGVFSMDGDLAPLDELVVLSRRHNAYLVIDECHATGHLGASGKGTPEIFGLQPDIITSTLGKSLGGATGGYVAASKDVVDLLRNKARPYLFSNSVAPAVVGASLKAFELLEDNQDLLVSIQENTQFFRTEMEAAGFDISGHHSCPIAPVMLYDDKLAAQFADKMLGHDIYVIAFSFPVVPRGLARIRVQLSAVHTREQLQRTVNAFINVGKELNVLK